MARGMYRAMRWGWGWRWVWGWSRAALKWDLRRTSVSTLTISWGVEWVEWVWVNECGLAVRVGWNLDVGELSSNKAVALSSVQYTIYISKIGFLFFSLSLSLWYVNFWHQLWASTNEIKTGPGSGRELELSAHSRWPKVKAVYPSDTFHLPVGCDHSTNGKSDSLSLLATRSPLSLHHLLEI